MFFSKSFMVSWLTFRSLISIILFICKFPDKRKSSRVCNACIHIIYYHTQFLKMWNYRHSSVGLCLTYLLFTFSVHDSSLHILIIRFKKIPVTNIWKKNTVYKMLSKCYVLIWLISDGYELRHDIIRHLQRGSISPLHSGHLDYISWILWYFTYKVPRNLVWREYLGNLCHDSHDR